MRTALGSESGGGHSAVMFLQQGSALLHWGVLAASAPLDGAVEDDPSTSSGSGMSRDESLSSNTFWEVRKV